MVVLNNSGEISISLSCTAHCYSRFLSTRRNFLLKSYIHCWHYANTTWMFWENPCQRQPSSSTWELSIYVQLQVIIIEATLLLSILSTDLRLSNFIKTHFSKDNQVLCKYFYVQDKHTGLNIQEAQIPIEQFCTKGRQYRV